VERFEGRIQQATGGGAYVEVPAEVITALGGGGRIPVEATFDVPEDLAAALEAGVREGFDKLSFSHRREHVAAINDAKKPETRARRIAKAVEMVSGR
jgi:uncharacterized protein YdeI (YjbR/CyaY-like superfamily)